MSILKVCSIGEIFTAAKFERPAQNFKKLERDRGVASFVF